MSGETAGARPQFGPVVLLALLSGPLLSMIDSNVVNVAVPDIAEELHGSLSSVQWTVSGYLLALAATLPATSWLARRVGTIRVYGVSLALFTLASVSCAFAGSVTSLVAGRVLQGVAAAPLVPLAMNLLFGGGPGGRRRFPISAAMVLFLGPALGPTIGGLLVSAWGWPAIFLINAPIGAAALVALPRLRAAVGGDRPDRTARFDPVGLALFSAGMAVALYGADRGPRDGWFAPGVWPLWAGGAALLAGYVGWAARRERPAVDLRLLRRGRSALAVGLCVVASAALFSVLFLVPVVLQDVQRHDAFTTGLVLLPQGVVMGLSTQLGAVLVRRGLLRVCILTGFAALALTSLSLLMVTAGTPTWATALALAGRGAAIGLVVQPLLAVTLAELAPAEVADATTVFNVGQRLGGSAGVALLATYFQQRVTGRIGDVLHAAHLPGAGPGPRHGLGLDAQALAGLPAGLRDRLLDAAVHGFHDTVWIISLIAAAGALLACALPARIRVPEILAGGGASPAGDAPPVSPAGTPGPPGPGVRPGQGR